MRLLLVGAATWLAAALAAQDPVAVFRDRLDAAARLLAGEAPADAVVAAHAAALDAFLHVPRDHPEYAALRSRAAESARQAGRFAWAVELVEEALREDVATEADVECLLGARLSGGDADAALGTARRLDAVFPAAVERFLVAARAVDAGALYVAAGRALRAGDTVTGLWAFDRVATATGEPLDLANLGLALRLLGRFEPAVELYERALAAAAHDDVLWSDYGLCLKSAGRLAEAEAAFAGSVAREAAPGAGPGTVNLALLRRSGRAAALGAPVEALGTVLAARPDQTLARRLLLDELLPRSDPSTAGDDTRGGRR